MSEWIIALSALAVIFFAAACVLASRCISLCEENRMLEAQNSELKAGLRATRAAKERLERQVYETTDARRISSLTLSLRLAQEKIESLEGQLRKKQTLLNQKWEGSRK